MVVKENEETLESFSFKAQEKQTNNLILKLQFRKTQYTKHTLCKK